LQKDFDKEHSGSETDSFVSTMGYLKEVDSKCSDEERSGMDIGVKTMKKRQQTMMLLATMKMLMLMCFPGVFMQKTIVGGKNRIGRNCQLSCYPAEGKHLNQRDPHLVDILQ
jgi:hypothetical protein